MIQWLVQSMADLAGETDQYSWLNADEVATFAKLNTPKRREDWLLGRWTAKQLVRSNLVTQRGEVWPLDRIGIAAESSGAPFIYDSNSGEKLLISLSISHSGGVACCAVVDQPGYRVGVDIERIELRSANFVTDFFTESEIESIQRTPEALQSLLITALWSSKEAALKTIGEGLRSDTRAVECGINPLPLPIEQWQPLAIRIDCVREPIGATISTWQGWWRSYQGFILTMVVSQSR